MIYIVKHSNGILERLVDPKIDDSFEILWSGEDVRDFELEFSILEKDLPNLKYERGLFVPAEVEKILYNGKDLSNRIRGVFKKLPIKGRLELMTPKLQTIFNIMEADSEVTKAELAEFKDLIKNEVLENKLIPEDTLSSLLNYF